MLNEVLPAFVTAEHDLCARGTGQRRLHGSAVQRDEENVVIVKQNFLYRARQKFDS